MGPWFNRQLVSLLLSEDDQVPLALPTDEQLTFLTSDLHRAKRFMRFNCVSDSLRELVPLLE